MADEVLTGTVVRLPDGAGGPFEVYVNGTPQREGADFVVEDAVLRFRRPLRRGRRMGAVRQFLFSLGVNFYTEGDAVDLHYRDAQGRPGHASELRVVEG